MFDLSTVAHMMNTYVCCVLCAIQKFHFHINLSYFQNIFLFAFRYNFLLMLHSQHDCQVNCNRYTFFHCDTKINAMKRHFYTLLLFFFLFFRFSKFVGCANRAHSVYPNAARTLSDDSSRKRSHISGNSVNESRRASFFFVDIFST